MRHTALLDSVAGGRSEVTTLARDYPPGYRIPTRYHDRDQLVYASRGVMTVRTRDGAWVVPTHRAAWIPAAVAHTIATSGAVTMRTVYLKPRLTRALPRMCAVVNVSPLLRELILRACEIGALRRTVARQRHLVDVMLDQLDSVDLVPLRLPTPTDARTHRVAGILMANPADRRPLADICRSAGASKRTVERLFQDEVGMTVGRWRQQLRLMQAMRLLASGAKVTHAALESGYRTPSAFITMFKRALGTTPRSYGKT
jgi:AraC-like DNA-binding protein